jgi:NAD(P)-dependent dehydrogenase (short-subunit alcohol dehydrogenase family)
MQIDFQDKNVFVMGGTSGINLGIADAFAESGARVAVASRSQEKVDAAVARLQQHNGEALGYVADVRDESAVARALGNAHDALGPLDVLVSGAAGNFPAPALGMSANAFRAVVEIDLQGTFHVLRSAYAYLARPGASVVNISAPQAFVPMELQAHVCAAKAGVDMITRVLAMEWGDQGVRVNSVVPGPIADTEGMRRLAPSEELADAVRQSVPLRRFGTAREIASMVMFLASPFANYVSGAVIPVDGGWSLGGVSAASAAMAQSLAKRDAD